MYILESKFIVNKTIGQLNSGQITQLKKQFSFFPHYINNDNGEHQFTGANQGIAISSADDSIVYFYQGESKEIDYQRIFDCIDAVRKLINEDESDYVGMSLQGISNYEGDTMEASLKKFPDYKVDDIVAGIGVRVLCKNEEFNGEVKVEPFINDTEKIFNFGNSVSIEKVIVNEETFEKQHKKLIEIAEKIQTLSFDTQGL